MCGIVAGYGLTERSEGERMLARLIHRGPDDAGSVDVNGRAWLGHRRLSIVDLDGGAQPLANDAGDLWLVGNGEIYNHHDVRAGLGAGDFRTCSDNEAALRLIDALGPRALGSLSGMYAFVAAGEDGRFIAARDPVGIKPLYWARRGEEVRFASEMGAFPPDWRPEVEVFPPGCFWTPEDGLVRFASVLPEAPPAPVVSASGETDVEAALFAIRGTLTAAVEAQMMGDVPVGVFLSGGLDSSLVAAIAADWLHREHGERLQTFAVGLDGSPDLEAARLVAEHIGSYHRQCVYTAEEAVAAVPEVVASIESFDPSLVRSAVPNFFLSRFTARHVKVVLTGEGADELFAGYDYLRSVPGPDALHRELERSIRGLHNLNLQRCDRVTMAHGLEARVPFLDRDVVALGMSLPAELKVPGPGRPEKWLLRRAFDGVLPDTILWRTKLEFGDGSGARDALIETVAATVDPDQFLAERDEVEPPIRTREEFAYYRIFRERLRGVRPEVTIGRFATA